MTGRLTIRRLAPADERIAYAICHRMVLRWRIEETLAWRTYFQPVMGGVEGGPAVFLAFVAGEWVGEVLSCVYPNYYCGVKEAHVVEALFVAPGYRSVGVGRALVSMVEEDVRSRGQTRVLLDTVSAKVFYHSLGYRDVGTAEWSETGETLFVLEKLLLLDEKSDGG